MNRNMATGAFTLLVICVSGVGFVTMADSDDPDVCRHLAIAANKGVIAYTLLSATDHKIRIYNIKKQRVERLLEAHKLPISSLSFSGDGDRLLSTGADGKVLLWNTSTWKHQDKSFGLIPTHARFSTTGHVIAMALYTEDKGMFLFDMGLGQKIFLKESGTWINGMAFSLDGSMLASFATVMSGQTGVSLWEVRTGKKKQFVRFQLDPELDNEVAICTIHFLPKGNHLAMGDNRGYVKVWDIQNQKEIKYFRAHAYPLSSICAIGDKLMATGSISGETKIWNRNTWTEVKKIESAKGFKHRIVFVPQTKSICVGEVDSNGCPVFYDISKLLETK